ncbi:hypothetical protein HYPSUDRAFT_44839 [Hypholoma sublateritium FD-334 SS-4]|uniref:Uncharacterized protein n=1 Tax=Hypholoma sublateritium (strain FD-334 SS-4) TaxID=945553 RepID=A0A0D2PF87_HYPSF|nr:hypothetical protein HYPSUDRAFT_44839 [Hypholoma sublateritium FD-334 SS-4]
MATAFTMDVSDEKAIISTFYHSDMLNTLLLGIYTPLYFGTMYIYLTKKSSKNRLVLAAITILFVTNVIGGVKLWGDIHRLIGTSGESLSDILSAESRAFDGTNSVLVELVFSGLPVIVADGLLIWRCFRIWDSSLRHIALSLILLLAEFVLFLTAMVINLSPNIDLTERTSPRLTSAGLFMALTVTLWTTILIAYRIHSLSNRVPDRNKPRFHNILEIITQSSFIYSLALVVDAMLGVVPLKQSNVWTVAKASFCMGIILSAIAVRQNLPSWSLKSPLRQISPRTQSRH